MEEPIYAIVDLETTSSSLANGKLIQFGCIFVQNQQIIGSYALNINPLEPISEHISDLTGIYDQDVKDAPLFEEVAGNIYQKLKDCIFVAHNVNFDFNFLNARFAEIGQQPLTIPAIDTVELSQILYPTLDSYKLTDLAEYFQFYHNRPHQADSDAYVTAELFIRLTQKILTLPKLTLDKIIQRGSLLTAQTRQYLKQLRKQMPQSKDDQFVVLQNLVLRKSLTSVDEEPTKEIKNLRPKQQELVNLIQADLTSNEKNILLEAPTGMGKTLAYLTAFADAISPKHPLIISTSSLVLQQQLLKEIANYNSWRPQQKLTATIVKANYHYLDLQHFSQTLNDAKLGYTDRLWQMKILVWLLETETGDLDEISANYNLPYLQKIGAKQLNLEAKSTKMQKYDFLRRLKARIQRSSVLIVNHAFLNAEQYRNQMQLPSTNYLLIDEAHQFSELFQASATIQLFVPKFKQQLRQLRKEFNKLNLDLPTEEFYLNKYSELLCEYQQLVYCKYKKEQEENYQVTPSFKQMSKAENDLREHLKQLTQTVTKTLQHLLQQKLSTYANSLIMNLQIFIDRFYLYLTTKEKHIYRELQFSGTQVSFNLLDIYHRNLEQQYWYQKFKKCFFLSSTLLVDGKADYFQQTLQLSTLKVQQIEDNGHYHGQIYVLTDQKNNSKWYDEKQLSNLLVQLVQHPKTNKILCLLTSHEQLQLVYQLVEGQLHGDKITLLAQDQTGSKWRNLKQFEKAENAILLGTDMFWEGIDLAGNSLNTVVIAKLPFRPPFEAFQQYKTQYLQEIGKQPFFDDALPRTMMKLRQGFGRLYRNPDDQGQLIILDKRFVTSSYAKKIQRAFPKQINIVETNFKQCLTDLSK